MPSLSILLLAAGISATATACSGLDKMENLVTFGDSLTDDGRADYWEKHGVFPPPGVEVPIVNASASGGASWGRIVAETTGARYNNYAVSGGTCSNKIVEITIAELGSAFPTVLEQEIPAFVQDVGFDNLYPNRQANNTVYNVCIGTNDLGILGYLSDSQAPGSTIDTYTNCIWDVLDKIYENGGRYLVLMTLMPLEITPLYKSLDKGGAESPNFWPSKADVNSTLYEQRAMQSITSANSLFQAAGSFHLKVQARWPGSTLVIFDNNQLLKDIYAEPEKYFDAPADVDGVYQQCVGWEDCQVSSKPLSSFMWFDELHPSERTRKLACG
ncbi:hypothetical protein F66182_7149 [Fusarium sp. NRRL 66182]|nr:hypothetical protein F66182_7149 [Fusarium sp. NRRL 66182]